MTLGQPFPAPTGFSQTPVLLTPKRPWATLTILALNFAILLLMALTDLLSHPPLREFLLRTLTGASADPELLLRFGASYGPFIRRGEYWRLVMPMFLHVGAIHLLVNAYALFILGRILEQVYGYARFALIYVGCGVGCALLSMTLSPNISAGASGAIFGIAGAMLVTGYLRRHVVPPRWGRAFGKGILPFIILNLGLGFSVRPVIPIDNWGHVGGLLSGILLAVLIPPTERELAPGPEGASGFQILTVIPIAVVAWASLATMGSYRTARQVSQLLQRGERSLSEREYGRALEAFQEAERLAPHDERPHEDLGSLYLEQKRVREAVGEYEEALRLSPVSPEAKLGLARAYQVQGNQAKARELLKGIHDALPKAPEGEAAMALLCERNKLYPEAIEHYQEALRMKPDYDVAHNNLAWLFATCDDPHYRNPRAALEHARRAVELSGWKEAGFIDTLAEALYASGDYAGAVKVQTKALELDPHNEELAEHMVRYRKAAGV